MFLNIIMMHTRPDRSPLKIQEAVHQKKIGSINCRKARLDLVRAPRRDGRRLKDFRSNTALNSGLRRNPL
ncbi:MAG: hypothetical protein LBP22_06395 [Deltaproteobacteria bacterium]|nr:hypothetical protein [Deltaproteobacteria bacterium]